MARLACVPRRKNSEKVRALQFLCMLVDYLAQLQPAPAWQPCGCNRLSHADDDPQQAIVLAAAADAAAQGTVAPRTAAHNAQCMDGACLNR